MTERGYNTPSARSHPQSVAVRYRSALKLMTMANTKSPKGESLGFLQAMLYLQPNTLGGGKTLCPHSTPSCEAMCLAGAGLSGLPVQMRAKQRRTDFYLTDPLGFYEAVARDIRKLVDIAKAENMTPCVRLNGTSDVIHERTAPWLFRDFASVSFHDYSKIPLHLRRPPPNYHLTYSIGGAEDMERAVGYLRAGHSVAVVVPEELQAQLTGMELRLGDATCGFINGDLHDLRFLDPPSSIVLLRPKGHVLTDLVRPYIARELRDAAKRMKELA